MFSGSLESIFDCYVLKFLSFIFYIPKNLQFKRNRNHNSILHSEMEARCTTLCYMLKLIGIRLILKNKKHID